MNKTLKNIIADVYTVDNKALSDAEAINLLKSSSSLKTMTLIATVEEHFKITFTDEEIISLLDIQSIEKILHKKIQLT